MEGGTMATYDWVIRNGTIVDGAGGVPFAGDIGIHDGVIVHVGKVEGRGRQEFEASGHHVVPGFVDIHTHYDGQAIWSDRMSPSSAHGVTTVVVGNCGVGFAPCREEDQSRLIKMMEGVEDIPGAVMVEGLKWDWETFPEFLRAIESRIHDIDIATLLPHSPLRVYVMGERGARREAATSEDLGEMNRLVCEAVEAGALGVSSSRAAVHRTADGDHIPSFEVATEELIALGRGIKQAGGGILQMSPEFPDASGSSAPEEMVIEAARRAGVGAAITTGNFNSGPARWEKIANLMAQAAKGGVDVFGQIFPRPNGIIMGLQHTLHPFAGKPSYLEIAHLPVAQRAELMRDPTRRTRILNEKAVKIHAVGDSLVDMRWTFPLADPPNYEPDPTTSIGAEATRLGIDPLELMYDRLLEERGGNSFFVAIGNFRNGTLDDVRRMFDHDRLVLGLGDGGAHYGFLSDASYPTFMLSYWTRERSRDRIPIERAVKMLTRDPASAVGLNDRGLLKTGYKADINILDYDRLMLRKPILIHDLPGGGSRLDQKARGYIATFVSGEPIARNDEPTKARPGRLVRGRTAPP
jgi:N-acyl-D-aspartate/D-glutamate deacylase